MKNAIIIGATGFGGLGLIEILLRHPEIRIAQLAARRDTGKPISRIFPHLEGFCDSEVRKPEEIDLDNIDIAFFSTPDRAGMTIISDFFNNKIPVIDFSGDFRFNSIEHYRVYAQNKGMEDTHHASDMLRHAVYGLPEVNAQQIQNASVVGNPGCFSIAMILSMLPAVEEGIIVSEHIICDGKTGVSGAGKNPGEANFYSQRYENVNSYREARHQHIVEVETLFERMGSPQLKIVFVPQIVPLNRGILVTSYADIREGINSEKVFELYSEYYREKPFITVTEQSPNTTDVRGTNQCRIKPMVDERTGKFITIAVIDNLLKGQSGNAIQNANIMLRIDETAGLMMSAFYP
jgi:N-acetyl-gamma-glutamyl-phosphate reductase